jgi:hypothetical protein
MQQTSSMHSLFKTKRGIQCFIVTTQTHGCDGFEIASTIPYGFSSLSQYTGHWFIITTDCR